MARTLDASSLAMTQFKIVVHLDTKRRRVKLWLLQITNTKEQNQASSCLILSLSAGPLEAPPSKFWQIHTLIDLWAFHLILRFSFWLTKLPETKIGCVIFWKMFSVCKARQARQKWKIIKKQTNYYVIFSFLHNFRQPKWKTKNGMKSS